MVPQRKADKSTFGRRHAETLVQIAFTLAGGVTSPLPALFYLERIRGMTTIKCRACGARCADEFCNDGCATLYAQAKRVIQTGRTLDGILRQGPHRNPSGHDRIDERGPARRAEVAL